MVGGNFPELEAVVDNNGFEQSELDLEANTEQDRHTKFETIPFFCSSKLFHHQEIDPTENII